MTWHHGAITCKPDVSAGGRRTHFRQWPCSGFSFCDELLRKSIATAAEWGDPSLDLLTVFGEVEKQVLEAARTRLLQTGLSRQQNQRNQNNQDANNRAKDGAEAERLTFKASQAAKELAKQQAQLETSMAAMSKDKDKRRQQRQWQGTHQQAEEGREVLRQAEAEHREEKVGERPPFWVVGAGGSPG